MFKALLGGGGRSSGDSGRSARRRAADDDGPSAPASAPSSTSRGADSNPSTSKLSGSSSSRRSKSSRDSINGDRERPLSGLSDLSTLGSSGTPRYLPMSSIAGSVTESFVTAEPGGYADSEPAATEKESTYEQSEDGDGRDYRDRDSALDREHEQRRRDRYRSGSVERVRDRRERSRSRDREQRSKERKESKGKDRDTDGAREERPREPTSSAKDRFYGFSQPMQYDGTTPGPGYGPGPVPPLPNFDPHVQHQFSGQFPAFVALPYRPPNPAGEAADYYGDHGESVQTQPGVRPNPPAVIVGTQPHLMTPSAIPNPPPEPSSIGQVGAAASYYSHNSGDRPDQAAGQQQQQPGKPPQPSAAAASSKPPRPPRPGKPHQPSASTDSVSTTATSVASSATATYGLSTEMVDSAAASLYTASSTVGGGTSTYYDPSVMSSSAPGQSTTTQSHSTGTALSAAAAGAAAGYAMGHLGHHASPSLESTQFTSTTQYTSTVTYQDSSYYSVAGTETAAQPGHYGSSTNAAMYAAGAAGAAGYAAASAAQAHDTQSSSSSPSSPASSQLAVVQRHDGPLKKFIEWWRDTEGVGKFEDYTERIGVCKDCFEPGTTSKDAPRKHHYYRRRRRSSAGSRTRISKLSSRSSTSSASEGSRRSGKSVKVRTASWLAAGGIAGYVAKTLFSSKYSDETYTVHSRREKEEVERASRRSERSRSRDRVENGVKKTRSRSSSRSRREYHHHSYHSSSAVQEAAVGVAIGPTAVAAAASTSRDRSRSRSPKNDKKSKKQSYSSSSSSSSSLSDGSGSYVDISRTYGKSGLMGFASFFSAPSENRIKKHRSSYRRTSGSNKSYSSSSMDADLAFGTGYIKRSKLSKSQSKKKKKEDHEDVDSAIVGLGAAATALAAASTSSYVRSRTKKSRVVKSSRRSGHVSSATADDDDQWEDAMSTDRESSSVSSGLAYGETAAVGGSRESLASLSGTLKWSWRWGSKKEKEKKRKSTSSDEHGGAALEQDAANSHDASRVHSPSSTSTIVPQKPPVVRPVKVPLQQPQPITPVSQSIYTSQGGATHVYTAPTGPPVFAADSSSASYSDSRYQEQTIHDAHGRAPRRSDTTPAVPTSPLAESPLSVPKRRATTKDQASVVQFELTAEQAEKERRIDRRERRRRERESSRRDETLRLIDEERETASMHVEHRERRQERTETSEKDYSYSVSPAGSQRDSPTAKEKNPSSSSSWAAPAAGGVIGAITAGAVFTGKGSEDGASDESQKRHEERREKRRAERRRASSEQEEGSPLSTTPPRIEEEQEHQRRKEREEERTRQKDSQSPSPPAKIPASRIISKTTSSHVHESYKAFFAPEEVRHRNPDGVHSKERPDAPKIIEIEPASEKFARAMARREEDTTTVKQRRDLPWPVPQLKLTEPTPPHSQSPSIRDAASPVVAPVDIVDEEQAGRRRESTGSRVSWGEHQMHEYEVPTSVSTSETGKEDLDSGKSAKEEEKEEKEEEENKLFDDTNEARDASSVVTVIRDQSTTTGDAAKPAAVEPETGKETAPQNEKTPGNYGDDIEFAATLAAGTAVSGFDPSMVTNNPRYYRRTSPPGSEEIGTYHFEYWADGDDLKARVIEEPDQVAPPEHEQIDSTSPSQDGSSQSPNGELAAEELSIAPQAIEELNKKAHDDSGVVVEQAHSTPEETKRDKEPSSADQPWTSEAQSDQHGGEGYQARRKRREEKRRNIYVEIVESARAAASETVKDRKPAADDNAEQKKQPFLWERPGMPETTTTTPGDNGGASGLSSSSSSLSSADDATTIGVAVAAELGFDLPPRSRNRPPSHSRTRSEEQEQRQEQRDDSKLKRISDPTLMSSTAVPLHFRRPPPSPGVRRPPSPAMTTPSPTTPTSRPRRPTSTEFKNAREMRPLRLVEMHASGKSESQPEGPPSSKSSSRRTSVEDLRAASPPPPQDSSPSLLRQDPDRIAVERRRPFGLRISTDQDPGYDRGDDSNDDIPSSQKTASFTPIGPPPMKEKKNLRYEFHSPSELLQDPSTHAELPSVEGSAVRTRDAETQTEASEKTESKVEKQELSLDLELQKSPPLPQSRPRSLTAAQMAELEKAAAAFADPEPEHDREDEQRVSSAPEEVPTGVSPPVMKEESESGFASVVGAAVSADVAVAVSSADDKDKDKDKKPGAKTEPEPIAISKKDNEQVQVRKPEVKFVIPAPNQSKEEARDGDSQPTPSSKGRNLRAAVHAAVEAGMVPEFTRPSPRAAVREPISRFMSPFAKGAAFGAIVDAAVAAAAEFAGSRKSCSDDKAVESQAKKEKDQASNREQTAGKSGGNRFLALVDAAVTTETAKRERSLERIDKGVQVGEYGPSLGPVTAQAEAAAAMSSSKQEIDIMVKKAIQAVEAPNDAATVEAGEETSSEETWELVQSAAEARETSVKTQGPEAQESSAPAEASLPEAGPQGPASGDHVEPEKPSTRAELETVDKAINTEQPSLAAGVQKEEAVPANDARSVEVAPEPTTDEKTEPDPASAPVGQPANEPSQVKPEERQEERSKDDENVNRTSLVPDGSGLVDAPEQQTPGSSEVHESAAGSPNLRQTPSAQVDEADSIAKWRSLTPVEEEPDEANDGQPPAPEPGGTPPPDKSTSSRDKEITPTSPPAAPDQDEAAPGSPVPVGDAADTVIGATIPAQVVPQSIEAPRQQRDAQTQTEPETSKGIVAESANAQAQVAAAAEEQVEMMAQQQKAKSTEAAEPETREQPIDQQPPTAAGPELPQSAKAEKTKEEETPSVAEESRDEQSRIPEATAEAEAPAPIHSTPAPDQGHDVTVTEASPAEETAQGQAQPPAAQGPETPVAAAASPPQETHEDDSKKNQSSENYNNKTEDKGKDHDLTDQTPSSQVEREQEQRREGSLASETTATTLQTAEVNTTTAAAESSLAPVEVPEPERQVTETVSSSAPDEPSSVAEEDKSGNGKQEEAPHTEGAKISEATVEAEAAEQASLSTENPPARGGEEVPHAAEPEPAHEQPASAVAEPVPEPRASSSVAAEAQSIQDVKEIVAGAAQTGEPSFVTITTNNEEPKETKVEKESEAAPAAAEGVPVASGADHDPAVEIGETEPPVGQASAGDLEAKELPQEERRPESEEPVPSSISEKKAETDERTKNRVWVTITKEASSEIPQPSKDDEEEPTPTETEIAAVAREVEAIARLAEPELTRDAIPEQPAKPSVETVEQPADEQVEEAPPPKEPAKQPVDEQVEKAPLPEEQTKQPAGDPAETATKGPVGQPTEEPTGKAPEREEPGKNFWAVWRKKGKKDKKDKGDQDSIAESAGSESKDTDTKEPASRPPSRKSSKSSKKKAKKEKEKRKEKKSKAKKDATAESESKEEEPSIYATPVESRGVSIDEPVGVSTTEHSSAASVKDSASTPEERMPAAEQSTNDKAQQESQESLRRQLREDVVALSGDRPRAQADAESLMSKQSKQDKKEEQKAVEQARPQLAQTQPVAEEKASEAVQRELPTAEQSKNDGASRSSSEKETQDVLWAPIEWDKGRTRGAESDDVQTSSSSLERERESMIARSLQSGPGTIPEYDPASRPEGVPEPAKQGGKEKDKDDETGPHPPPPQRRGSKIATIFPNLERGFFRRPKRTYTEPISKSKSLNERADEEAAGQIPVSEARNKEADRDSGYAPSLEAAVEPDLSVEVEVDPSYDVSVVSDGDESVEILWQEELDDPFTDAPDKTATTKLHRAHGRHDETLASPPRTPLDPIREEPAADPAGEAPAPRGGTPRRSPGSLAERIRTPSASSMHSLRSSVRSQTSPPFLLRRATRVGGDLRAAATRPESAGYKDQQPPADLDLLDIHVDRIASSSTYDPVTDKGKRPLRGMTDVYEGWGEQPGSPLSPSRPPSIRRRRSIQHVQELEARLDQLVSENRLLQAAKDEAESQLARASVARRRSDQALNQRDADLRDKDAQIAQLQSSVDWLRGEVARLTAANEELLAQRQRGTQEEDIVRDEIGRKNQEIARLRDQVAALQRQITAAAIDNDNVLTVLDDGHFARACEQLCHHVQQWVVRFSKHSDLRRCRPLAELRDERLADRFAGAVLDGSDVDADLADRVRRRDVFTAVVMAMVCEFVFARYLFGMDREQRQKLKALEKQLAEAAPRAAVQRWRATTLTLLARRPAFEQQRARDTEAVAQEIFGTLARLLPPPQTAEGALLDSLRGVLRHVARLAVEMRTQRAEYVMLPPLQPARFDAARMHERSGLVSDGVLEQQGAVVRFVLFPLMVRKDGDDEVVVYPAQVLVARASSERMDTPSDMV